MYVADPVDLKSEKMRIVLFLLIFSLSTTKLCVQAKKKKFFKGHEKSIRHHNFGNLQIRREIVVYVA